MHNEPPAHSRKTFKSKGRLCPGVKKFVQQVKVADAEFNTAGMRKRETKSDFKSATILQKGPEPTPLKPEEDVDD